MIDHNTGLPDNLAVITTASILDKTKPIGRVSHDDEGDWQFLPLTDNLDLETSRIVGLGEIIALDPSVVPTLHLKNNMVAWRSASNADWVFADRHEKGEGSDE